MGATAALLILAGCGGGGGKQGVGRGEVTGLVSDANGDPVRNATVSAGDKLTHTDEAGSYVLTGVRAEDLNVSARVSAGGVTLRGVNLARVYDGESAHSVNIAVYPENGLASLSGQIRSSGGNVLSGARVYARPTGGGVLSSAIALTDRDGFYEIQDLAKGVEYQIVASARTLGDDGVVRTIASDAVQDFVLKGVTDRAPLTPTGLRAVAFTTLGLETESRGVSAAKRAEAIEGVKRLRDPKRAARMAKFKGRVTPSLNPIAVDLTWDEYDLNPTVRPTGFIVYRNEVPAVDNGTLLLDPLASLYSDADADLAVGVPYVYTMKAVSTGYGSDSNAGRSDPSAAVSATPLNDLFLNDAVGRTVSWTSVANVAQYTVYVYRDYPTLNSAANLVATVDTTGTFVSVDSVTTGNYYYLVVGRNADGTAETYSEIKTFSAP